MVLPASAFDMSGTAPGVCGWGCPQPGPVPTTVGPHHPDVELAARSVGELGERGRDTAGPVSTAHRAPTARAKASASAASSAGATTWSSSMAPASRSGSVPCVGPAVRQQDDPPALRRGARRAGRWRPAAPARDRWGRGRGGGTRRRRRRRPTGAGSWPLITRTLSEKASTEKSSGARSATAAAADRGRGQPVAAHRARTGRSSRHSAVSGRAQVRTVSSSTPGATPGGARRAAATRRWRRGRGRRRSRPWAAVRMRPTPRRRAASARAMSRTRRPASGGPAPAASRRWRRSCRPAGRASRRVVRPATPRPRSRRATPSSGDTVVEVVVLAELAARRRAARLLGQLLLGCVSSSVRSRSSSRPPPGRLRLFPRRRSGRR